MRDFGSNPGDLRMWVYQPGPAAEATPVVVALHGCKQNARDYAADSGWLKYAKRFSFVLLLPEQKRGWFGNNRFNCFNWYYRGDQAPDRGEALSIKQMIDTLIARNIADPVRVYITGFSAGGAMSVVMLSSYPRSFAGGAVVAAVPYGCSQVPSHVPQWWLGFGWRWSYTDPFHCMLSGIDLTPAQWGDKVRRLHATAVTTWPPISIWHGKRDATVAVANALELTEQWTNLHGVTAAPQVRDHPGYSHHRYLNRNGRSVVELYVLNELGHGQPIRPGGGWFRGADTDECGRKTRYMQKSALCASYRIAQSWGLVPRQER